MSSACNAWGPNGARCEIRKHHVGEHAGMSTEGEWLQWRGVAQLRPTQTSAGLPQIDDIKQVSATGAGGAGFR